ncbi:MAG TPA: carboxypeptidase-like regulatory domain-containing protein [Planctomycetota bacterium]|nr:carboxypeptidase-like regulatory domain-containing protein [Planctomycetota bacterium]
MIRFAITLRGQPAGGVPITLIQSGEDRHMVFQTEADGTQLVRGLPPHEYGIYIASEDAIPYSGEVQVLPGATVSVAVDLKPGGKVYGTVTDRAGRPIADARILLLKDPSKHPAGGTGAVSDKEGHYALKGISPGAFGVRYRHVLYKPLDRMGLLFRESSDEYRIDVVLDLGAFVSGRVVDEADVPIEGARVMGGNNDSGGVAKSAADGSFTVTGLTDPPANFSATKPGYGKVVLRNLSGNPTGVLFRLPKAGTVLVRLQIDTVPPQTQITLSRYDHELGQVIPEESKFFPAGQDNAFAFDDVTPGTYWIEVRVAGYEPVDRPQVVVASGQITKPALISMRKKN